MQRRYEIDESALARLEKIGGAKLVRRMIDLFLESASKRIASALGEAEKGDIDPLSEVVHQLKSNARTFGANDLGFIAERIEVLLRTQRMDDLPRLLAELDSAFREAEGWLKFQREKFGP